MGGGGGGGDVVEPSAAKRAKFLDDMLAPVGIVVYGDKLSVASAASRAFQLWAWIRDYCARNRARSTLVLFRVEIVMHRITHHQIWRLQVGDLSECNSRFTFSSNPPGYILGVNGRVNTGYVDPDVLDAIRRDDRYVFSGCSGLASISYGPPGQPRHTFYRIGLRGGLDPDTHFLGGCNEFHDNYNRSDGCATIAIQPYDQDWVITFGNRATREEAVRFVDRITRRGNRHLPMDVIYYIVDRFCIVPSEAGLATVKWHDERSARTNVF